MDVLIVNVDGTGQEGRGGRVREKGWWTEAERKWEHLISFTTKHWKTLQFWYLTLCASGWWRRRLKSYTRSLCRTSCHTCCHPRYTLLSSRRHKEHYLIANAINLPVNLPSQAEGARRKARSLGTIANFALLLLACHAFMTDLLCITSPNACLPVRNANIPIPTISTRICPNVPFIQ